MTATTTMQIPGFRGNQVALKTGDPCSGECHGLIAHRQSAAQKSAIWTWM